MSLPRAENKLQPAVSYALSSVPFIFKLNIQEKSTDPVTLPDRLDADLHEEELLTEIKESGEPSEGWVGSVNEPFWNSLSEVPLAKQDSQESEGVSGSLSESKPDNNCYPESPSKTDCAIEYVQTVGRLFVKFVDSAAPVYLFKQCLPMVSMPNAVMIEMGGFVFNDRVEEVTNAFVTKPDPFSGLRADGHGSVCYGMVKQGVKKGIVLTGIVAVGYGLGVLVMTYGENLQRSNNPTLQSIVMTAFTHPAFSIPLLGLIGQGLNKLSLAAWNYSWSTCQESLQEGKVNLVQEFGQYSMSYYHAFTADTMLDWYMVATGMEGVNANPRGPMLRLMSCYAVLEGIKYTSSQPCAAKEKKRGMYYTQEAERNTDIIEQVQPSYRQGFYHLAKRASINLFLLGMGYACDVWVTCYAAPGVCEENTLGHRTIRDGIALGGALFGGYLCEKALPKVYQLGCSFFNRHKRKGIYDSLLAESEEDIKNSQFNRSFELT